MYLGCLIFLFNRVTQRDLKTPFKNKQADIKNSCTSSVVKGDCCKCASFRIKKETRFQNKGREWGSPTLKELLLLNQELLLLLSHHQTNVFLIEVEGRRVWGVAFIHITRTTFKIFYSLKKKNSRCWKISICHFVFKLNSNRRCFLPRHGACAPTHQWTDDVYPVSGGAQWEDQLGRFTSCHKTYKKSLRETKSWEVRRVWRSQEGARRATTSCG